jgi:hypothetical protein
VYKQERDEEEEWIRSERFGLARPNFGVPMFFKKPIPMIYYMCRFLITAYKILLVTIFLKKFGIYIVGVGDLI